MVEIPFNRPYLTGRELNNIEAVLESGRLTGTGGFTAQCQQWLEEKLSCSKAILMNSCSDALEVAAILCGIEPGDEVIMPSFTFVSTATSFVLRGAVPVFVDIRPDTLNLDEKAIECALTDRTKAIVAVHYAGVACEMDRIIGTAERHGLFLIEDAAQALLAQYEGRYLGTLGHCATISFHETKNTTSGEGGALLINEASWLQRAEIISEKGTDRARFFRGEIDRYTWRDLGSSYMPSQITSAFLYAQLEEAEQTMKARLALWARYHKRLQPLESQGLLQRPVVPLGCAPNAHIYYILVQGEENRNRLIRSLASVGIGSAFHYIPLHSSPAGVRFGRSVGPMKHTTFVSSKLVRLPLWRGMTANQVDRVVKAIGEFLGAR